MNWITASTAAVATDAPDSHRHRFAREITDTLRILLFVLPVRADLS